MCGTDVWALSEVLDGDLPPEELQRLARVDALLRAVTACDRRSAIAPNGAEPRSVEGEAR
jgi:hypothetical protein